MGKNSEAKNNEEHLYGLTSVIKALPCMKIRCTGDVGHIKAKYADRILVGIPLRRGKHSRIT